MDEFLTVSELTTAIKKHLESRFPLVAVKGEISNFKEQSSGHLYFTLKDAEAQISAVLFRGNAKTLTRLPKGGDQVVIRGELSVYPPKGNYQLIVRDLKYAGVGELLLKWHELKARLEAKGWFDKQRKKKLPPFPKTIGVVTSPTGAVIQDIVHILNRRFSGVHLILNPVKVQGEGAAQEIAQAINQFNRHKLADVLIVGRGGGSLEDLWAFNEECVAEAIFRSEIPIISAVGHETDFSIADYVADIRAPTPSAAAEIVIAEKQHHLGFLSQTHKRLTHTLSQLVRIHRHKLEGIARHPLFSSPYAILGQASQRLDDLREEITAGVHHLIATKKMHLASCKQRLTFFSPATRVKQLKEKLDRLSSHLRAINPKNLLTKGYCILFREKGDSVIFSAKDVHPQEKLSLHLHDGNLKVEVYDI